MGELKQKWKLKLSEKLHLVQNVVKYISRQTKMGRGNLYKPAKVFSAFQHQIHQYITEITAVN